MSDSDDLRDKARFVALRIEAELRETNGNIVRAARRLNLSRAVLRYLLSAESTWCPDKSPTD